MKHIAAILLLCLTANAGPIGFMQPRIGGTSLVGWWTLNATNAGVTADSSGNALTGTLVNSPAITNGLIGNALNFNSASAQVVNCGSGSTLTTFTLSAWMFFRGSGSSAGLIYRDTGTPFRHNYYWNISSNGKMNLGFWNGASYAGASTTGTILSNQWMHVAAVYSGGSCTLYTNGVAAGSASSMGTPTPSGTQTLAIGGTVAQATDYFNGIIDDPRIYSTALTASEILQLYNGGRGTQQ